MDDPKKAAGDLKDPLHLLPTVALRQMAHVLYLGAVTKKYGIYNWRESDGVKATTYIAALWRHLFQFMDGEDQDADSGKSHLAHIMATCAILLDAESVGKLIDDRTKTKARAAVWEHPCGNPVLCANAMHMFPCQSCVERPEGWTNYKGAE